MAATKGHPMTITIQTEKPVAYDSPDHVYPFGTANDNSTDAIFNDALFALIPPRDVRLLDIGCSGGGFVKSILDAGGLAVGVEGRESGRRLQEHPPTPRPPGDRDRFRVPVHLPAQWRA